MVKQLVSRRLRRKRVGERPIDVVAKLFQIGYVEVAGVDSPLPNRRVELDGVWGRAKMGHTNSTHT